jgi:hypothetical protein
MNLANSHAILWKLHGKFQLNIYVCDFSSEFYKTYEYVHSLRLQLGCNITYVI